MTRSFLTSLSNDQFACLNGAKFHRIHVSIEFYHSKLIKHKVAKT